MKVYVIRTGMLKNDINLSLSHAVLATRSNPDPKAQWYESPSYAVLIDHPQAGWILYDLGTHAEANQLWPKSVTESCYYVPVAGETMEEQLALLELRPSDIQHVILSHMHMDHIGNIQLFRNTAEFYVARAEASHAFLTVCSSREPEDHGFYYRKDVLTSLKKLHYIDEDGPLFDGVDAIILPGHTPGTMGLLLHLRQKNIILTSDALNNHWNYTGILPGVIADSSAFFLSLKKIKKLQKQYNAEIWFSHDMEQYRTFKHIPEYIQ